MQNTNTLQNLVYNIKHNTKNFLAVLAVSATIMACSPAPVAAQPVNPYTSQIRSESLSLVHEMSKSLGAVVAQQGNDKAIEVAKDAVRDRLKDPMSAMFRELELKAYSEGYVLCGEVNAKNSYGAYVGFKSFVAGAVVADMYTASKYPDLTAAANAGIIAACGY